MTERSGGAGTVPARPGLWTGSVVTAAAILVAAWLIPTYVNLRPTAGNDIAPAFMPLVCAVLIAALGASMLVRAMLGREEGGREEGGREEGTAADDADRRVPARAVLGDLAVWTVSTVLVLVLMPVLGFVATGALLLAAWLAYAGLRSWPVGVAVAVAVPLLLDWLCWQALRIQLP